MKLDARQIETTTTVAIAGKEDWLSAIYEHFPPEKGADRPDLTGNITVDRVADTDSYVAKAAVSYRPYVDCSLCGTKIRWNIEESETRYFQEKSTISYDQDNEADLTSEQCDEHILEDGHINVLDFINDIIMLSIPARLVARSKDDPDQCRYCDRNLAEVEVYRESPKPEDDPNNPFQALKSLKGKLH